MSLPDGEPSLVDFFVICGLDESLGLRTAPYFASSSNDCGDVRLLPPLERPFLASILGRYPDGRPDSKFYDQMLALCLPRGVRFRTQKDVPNVPAFHTFTNILEDGSRIDGCALVFYEKITNTSILDSMHNLHTEHVRELTKLRAGANHNESDGNPPRWQVANNSGGNSGGIRTLPRMRTTLPGSGGGKRLSYYDLNQDDLFVSKALCLITRLPIVHATETLLWLLYHECVMRTEAPNFPPESYVYWMLHELPLPPCGASLKVTIGAYEILCQRPDPDELPFFDYNLSDVFKLLPVDKFLKVLTCVFLEHQILLCSTDIFRLQLVAESLCTLLYPFKWAHVYVPILPYAQKLFLEAPLPFIMGLCYDVEIPHEVYQSTLCVCDIDAGHVELPEDLPALPDRANLATELSRCLKYGLDGGPLGDDNDSGTGSAGVPDGGNELTTPVSVEPVARRLNAKSHSVDLADTADNFHAVLEGSESLQRVQAIARRAGVNVDMDRVHEKLSEMNVHKGSPAARKYFSVMRQNSAIRELVLNKIVSLFYAYENFIASEHLAQFKTREEYLSSRDSVHNFDKVAFLSDQPESHLNFLAAFLETQMFASFIDCKITSLWDSGAKGAVQLFDSRLHQLQKSYAQGIVATPTRDQVKSDQQIESLGENDPITRREHTTDYVVPQPGEIKQLDKCQLRSRHEFGKFPVLYSSVLSVSPTVNLRSPWKQRHNRVGRNGPNGNHEVRPVSTYGVVDVSGAQTQIAHGKFVEQLITETKARTKRMLVEKMGRREAAALGHAEQLQVSGVEENTLVASFCDLLERIWAHGAVKKQSKSALWTHILAQQEWDKRLQAGTDPRANQQQSLTSGPPNGGTLQNVRTGRSDDKNRQKSPFQSKARSNSLAQLGMTDAQKSVVDESRSKVDSRRKDSLPPTPRGAVCDENTCDQNTCGETDKGPGSAMSKSLVGSTGRQIVFQPYPSTSTNVDKSTADRSADLKRDDSQALLQHMHQLQAETSLDQDENVSGNGEAWSASLLRAATFLVDRMSERQRNRVDSIDSVDNSASQQSSKFHRGTSVNIEQCSGGDLTDYRMRYGTPQPRQRHPSITSPPSGGTAILSKVASVGSSLSKIGRAGSAANLIAALTGFGGANAPDTDLTTPQHWSTSGGVGQSRVSGGSLSARAGGNVSASGTLPRHFGTQRQQGRKNSEAEMQYQVWIISTSGGPGTLSSGRLAPLMNLASGGAQNVVPIKIHISGSLRHTPPIEVPENSTNFKFEHANLGALSTLRIGHKQTIGSAPGNYGSAPEPAGTVPKWFLDEVVVRNELTGHTYRFPCGRWFGRGVDDGSLERILIAQLVPLGEPSDEADDSIYQQKMSYTPALSKQSSNASLHKIASGSQQAQMDTGYHNPANVGYRNQGNTVGQYGTNSLSRATSSGACRVPSVPPPRARSPSAQRRGDMSAHANLKARINSLQHRLGECVNAVVKHFYKAQQNGDVTNRDSKAELTRLLCGDSGLVQCVHDVFLLNFKSRFFKPTYPWDYVERCATIFYDAFFRASATKEQRLQSIHSAGVTERPSKEQLVLMKHCCTLVARVGSRRALGKDGKFHAFVLLALRDHVFSGLLPLWARTSATSEFYDEPSFLVTQKYLSFLMKLLCSLNEFQFDLERSLTAGVEHD